MLECDVVQDLFKSYHDGMCSDRTVELINEHLESCEQCRNEYQILYACEDAIAEKEKDIYERGMEMIAKKQKEKTLSKIVFIDTLFNIGIIGFVIRLLGDIVMVPGFSGEETGFTILIFILVAFGMFAGCELVYFIFKQRGHIPYITENIAKISIAVKVGLLFFFIVIACVFGLGNIYSIWQEGLMM